MEEKESLTQKEPLIEVKQNEPPSRSWIRLPNPQMIIAFSVALISLCALVVSIYQASVMREQQRLMMEQTKAAVWPHVEILVGSSPYPGLLYNISINNKGVGPAIIENVSVELEGETKRNWKEIFEFVTQEKRAFKSGFAKVKDRVLSPNEEVLALVAQSDSTLAKGLYKYGSRIKIKICYKSVFGDYWLHTRHGIQGGEDLEHKKVKSCTIKEEEKTDW